MAETVSQLFLLRLSRRAGVAVIVIGALVLLGWALNIQVFKSLAPNLIAMNPLSAVLFILTGVALVRTPKKRAKGPDKTLLICAAIVALGGAMKIVVCMFGLDLDVDQWLFREGVNLPWPFGPN